MKEEEPLVTMKTGAEIVRDCGTEILRLENEAESNRSKIVDLQKIMQIATEMDKPFAHLLKEAEK